MSFGCLQNYMSAKPETQYSFSFCLRRLHSFEYLLHLRPTPHFRCREEERQQQSRLQQLVNNRIVAAKQVPATTTTSPVSLRGLGVGWGGDNGVCCRTASAGCGGRGDPPQGRRSGWPR